ncbi:MAG: hypothetical protein AB1546_13410, partial [bacterium]
MTVDTTKIKEEAKKFSYNLYAVAVFAVAVLIFAVFRYFNASLQTLGLSQQLILLIGGPAVLFLCLANLEMGLVFFIYTVPIVGYYIIADPFYLTFSDIFLILLIFVWALRFTLRKECVPYRTHLDKYIFIFILLSLFSAVN